MLHTFCSFSFSVAGVRNNFLYIFTVIRIYSFSLYVANVESSSMPYMLVVHQKFQFKDKDGRYILSVTYLFLRLWQALSTAVVSVVAADPPKYSDWQDITPGGVATLTKDYTRKAYYVQVSNALLISLLPTYILNYIQQYSQIVGTVGVQVNHY